TDSRRDEQPLRHHVRMLVQSERGKRGSGAGYLAEQACLDRLSGHAAGSERIERITGEVEEKKTRQPVRRQGRVDQESPAKRERRLLERVEEDQKKEASRADSDQVFRDRSPTHRAQEKGDDDNSEREQHETQHSSAPGRWARGHARSGLHGRASRSRDGMS